MCCLNNTSSTCISGKLGFRSSSLGCLLVTLFLMDISRPPPLFSFSFLDFSNSCDISTSLACYGKEREWVSVSWKRKKKRGKCCITCSFTFSSNMLSLDALSPNAKSFRDSPIACASSKELTNGTHPYTNILTLFIHTNC